MQNELVTYYGFKVRPENFPLKRPGAYRITCLVNGKPYIGISLDVHRRTRWYSKASDKTKFGNALRKYSIENFLVEPVFYWTDGATHDRLWLCQLEAKLIAEHDSVRNGYNVVAASGTVGPYGKEFAEIIRQWHASRTPEERAATIRKGIAKMTPEELSARGRNNALAQGRDILVQRMYNRVMAIPPEQRIATARKAGIASAAAKTPEEIKAWLKLISEAYVKSTTPEQRYENYKKSGVGKMTSEELSRLGTKGVTTANNNRTPAERSALARKAAAASHASRTPEERIELARLAGFAAASVLTFEQRSKGALKRGQTLTAEQLTRELYP